MPLKTKNKSGQRTRRPGQTHVATADWTRPSSGLCPTFLLPSISNSKWKALAEGFGYKTRNNKAKVRLTNCCVQMCAPWPRVRQSNNSKKQTQAICARQRRRVPHWTGKWESDLEFVAPDPSKQKQHAPGIFWCELDVMRQLARRPQAHACASAFNN